MTSHLFCVDQLLSLTPDQCSFPADNYIRRITFNGTAIQSVQTCMCSIIRKPLYLQNSNKPGTVHGSFKGGLFLSCTSCGKPFSNVYEGTLHTCCHHALYMYNTNSTWHYGDYLLLLRPEINAATVFKQSAIGGETND